MFLRPHLNRKMSDMVAHIHHPHNGVKQKDQGPARLCNRGDPISKTAEQNRMEAWLKWQIASLAHKSQYHLKKN
jgi:hypothetical protein